jgi:ADP-glucose pyrophosphorylase
MNYGMFVRAYERSGFKAAIAVTRCRGKVSDFGTVETDRAGRIFGFYRKRRAQGSRRSDKRARVSVGQRYPGIYPQG